MKIGVLSASALPSPPPSYGGLENIAASVADGLSLRGHDVTLFAAKGSRPAVSKVVEGAEPAFTPGSEADTFRTVLPELLRCDIVIDHSHQHLAARSGMRKVIQVIHDLMPPYDWLSYGRPSYCVSQFHARFMAGHTGLTDAGYVYNCITDIAYPAVLKGNYLLFLGRMEFGKGAHLFVELCRRLNMKGVVAGDDSTGHGISPGYRDAVMQLCAKAGVAYYGLVDSVTKKEIIAGATALVSPLTEPYYEVFGIAMLEALAAGLPVFTTDRGSPKEIITQGTGYVAADFPDLEAAVRRFLDQDDLYSPDSCVLRAKEFSMDRMTDRWENILHGIEASE